VVATKANHVDDASMEIDVCNYTVLLTELIWLGKHEAFSYVGHLVNTANCNNQFIVHERYSTVRRQLTHFLSWFAAPALSEYNIASSQPIAIVTLASSS